MLQGPGAKQSNYLAASTKQHVLLFDTRRFNAPVLCWAHSMDTEPPQLLAFALSSQTPCRSSNIAVAFCAVSHPDFVHDVALHDDESARTMLDMSCT